ncbi:MAG: LCP family protein [Bacilli bacterium]|nr:LCP family protein [Bacilli bacterium]
MTRKELKREKLKAKEKKHKGFNVFVGFLLGMYLTISGYLIYNLYNLTGIEDLIRYIIMGILIISDLFLIVKYFKMKRKTLLRKYIIFTLVLLIFGGLQFFIGYTINKGLNVIDKISNKEYKIYKTSLVALKDGNIQKVSDITDSTKIGRVSDEDDIENNVLSKHIMEKDDISEDQIVDYDDPITLLYDLYEKKDIEAAFISGSYVDIYKTMQKFENISEDLIELDKYSKKMKVKKEKETMASTKSISEPFTMLLMGVDTQGDITETSGLGDSLTLVTFNPQTLNVTILSIPRDTFVPITCYRNVRSKITHAASGGDKCMISTIENFFDVDIDYYVKINFSGLIKIVDALGGIDVEVPYSFCESDENRTFKNPIFLEKGYQHLDGRQALGLSRNRKTYPTCGAKWNQGTRNDFVRGQNQQLVINAIINKAKTIRSVDQFYALLDAVGGSIVTNMDRKQILAFYNIFKNILVYSSDLTDDNNIIDMQKIYLNGSGAMIQDGIMTSMNLYEYIPSTQSLNAIKKAMKVNLGLAEDTPKKEFSFSADKPYEQEVIGKNLSGGIASYPTVPTTTESDNKCTGDNEELGADKKTCVCKNGYTRTDGVCTKKEEKTCTAPYELSGDKQSCLCPTWNGYVESNGTCTSSSGDSGSGSTDSGSTDSGSGSTDSGSTDSGSSSGSTDSTSTDTTTP